MARGEPPARSTHAELGQHVREVVAAAGYRPDEPLVVAAGRAGIQRFHFAQGVTSTGGTVSDSTLFYAASLAKQVTAACAALLVRADVLDMDASLSGWMPELPGWADDVRLHHLVHHTAALPPDADIDAQIASVIDADRTTAGVLGSLVKLPMPDGRSGAEHVYSNVGYVCLATVVERAAGGPLPSFAHDRLFSPAGMLDTCLWSGPSPAPPNAVVPAPAQPAPLSLGDGGLWSTAGDLLRWGAALDDDRFGITGQLQTAGRLDDGTELDYAWGMGVRSRSGRSLFRHGGAWANSRVMLVRAPDLGLSLVAAGLADRTERTVRLANALSDLLIGQAASDSTHDSLANGSEAATVQLPPSEPSGRSSQES